MTWCKEAMNLSFHPLHTPFVTSIVTPGFAILTTLVRVVYATIVMYETIIYIEQYAA